MNKPLLAIATAGLMLTSTHAIFAHHSVARFDTATPVTIKGTLRRADIVNPHSYLYVEQTTPDGTILWAVEGPAPNGLLRRGFGESAFREGETFEACGYMLRDEASNPNPGTRLLVAEVLVMPDGLARLWSPYGQDLCRQQGTYAIVE
jgi:Family of unknown function (DUF6152)